MSILTRSTQRAESRSGWLDMSVTEGSRPEARDGGSSDSGKSQRNRERTRDGGGDQVTRRTHKSSRCGARWRGAGMKYTWMESPVGRLLLAGDAAGLRSVSFLTSNRADVVREDWVEDRLALRDVERQLRDYFAGALRRFDLQLAPVGTEFQLRVWRELRVIPYGETISYGELAKRVGNAKASRAVGLANGCNPIAIIVPCHRVIGTDGSLTGFGGGLRNKEILLELESGQGRLL
jgi:methylated-DNA-[protein]-cysteine S-methyltransferase